jgi:hypothetical protein
MRSDEGIPFGECDTQAQVFRIISNPYGNIEEESVAPRYWGSQEPEFVGSGTTTSP